MYINIYDNNQKYFFIYNNMDINDPVIINALADLSDRFDIIEEPIYLSLLKEQHGEKQIFDRLLRAYRPVFANNQRILVVQDRHEIYSYKENFSSDALVFLQETLQKIDISNFFVIVISSNPQIKEELEWVRQKRSTDDIPINFHLVTAPFTRQEVKKDSFCFLPWMHLHVNTHLEIAPCCVADQTKPWGSLQKNTVMEIVNSDRANTMRLNMLNGISCSECKNCYTKEKSYQGSRRTKINKQHQHLRQHFIDITNQDGSLKKFEPLLLDIRLNNICNLKCRTCDGKASSQIAHEEKKIFNNHKNYNLIPNKTSRSEVLNKTITYIDHAYEIYFAGGEPLIMHEHYSMLDRLINSKKTNTSLVYSTNFTHLEFKNLNILDYWQKFTDVALFASIDGYGAIFEYVRHGASWHDIEKNLIKLKDKCPHVKFHVLSTISIFSAESVMELQQKWHGSGLLDINCFQLNLVSINDFFSLSTLLPHHKQYLAKKINAHRQWLMSVNANALEKKWRDIETSMWSEDKSHLNLMIAPVNQARDIERRENFESLYPQFADLFVTGPDSKKFNYS